MPTRLVAISRANSNGPDAVKLTVTLVCRPGKEITRLTVCVSIPVDASSDQVPVPVILQAPVDRFAPRLKLGNVACTVNGTLRDAACAGTDINTKARIPQVGVRGPRFSK